MNTKPIITIICLLGAVFSCYIFFTMWKPFSFRASTQTVNANGAQLVYYTRGKGKPLVFINGFGMTMQDWDPLLLEKLSQHHELIVFDDRGVGDSTGDISHLSESQMAEDTIGLMNALHIQKADVLGWSMGSFIAQVTAEAYPNRINKLLLVSTGPDQEHMILGTDDNNPDVTASWESGFLSFMFSDTFSQQAYTTRLHNAIATGEAPQVTRENAAVRAQQEQAMADHTQEQFRYDQLSSIQAPTLLIGGEKDTILPPQNSTLVSQRIPNSKVVIIPNAGHAVMFEKPQEFVNVVEKFLK